MSAATTPVQRRNAYIAWATICLVWGTTYLGIKVALESIDRKSTRLNSSH